ncbi:hypothetical protein EYF80_023039 [Liparis tanakae]|uniref:Uncharacterized protein n=1 Tax=Liparis tanakae TaxID=230148 RepID=A0A4Z2HM14_9TELE|nr:hypothetical protein EYF80_023039 [Liparis tanakae]
MFHMRPCGRWALCRRDASSQLTADRSRHSIPVTCYPSCTGGTEWVPTRRESEDIKCGPRVIPLARAAGSFHPAHLWRARVALYPETLRAASGGGGGGGGGLHLGPELGFGRGGGGVGGGLSSGFQWASSIFGEGDDGEAQLLRVAGHEGLTNLCGVLRGKWNTRKQYSGT